MRKTYCFKLYRAKRNQKLHAQIELGASVYNHCIAVHRRYYRLYKKHVSLYLIHKHITKLKKLRKFQHWNQLNSQALQDIADRIERGYTLFFRSLKTKSNTRRAAPPSFRKRSKYRSITLKQTGYKLLEGNKIKIGKQVFRYHNSREIVGTIKTVTIKRDALGDFYLYFSCIVDDVQPERTMTGKIAGFDFGLKTFLAISDGTDIASPQFFKRGLREIQRANQQVSSKKRGSNNRHKARLNLARVHRKIANQRKDFHFKTAKALTDKYDFMFFEDLNLDGMKTLWGRKVSDLGFDSFQRILQHMATKAGSEISQIDRWFPSSKTCHVCGSVNDSLTLRDRTWICTCGANHDRDRNAAINILLVGASTSGLGDVRQVLAPAIAV